MTNGEILLKDIIINMRFRKKINLIRSDDRSLFKSVYVKPGLLVLC